jgi:flagellar motor protein MotB
MLMIGGSGLAALPLVKAGAPVTPHLLVEDGAASDNRAGSRDDTPLAELTEALEAAQAKLEELDRAAAALASAASLRAELTAKEEENRQLRAALQDLQARRTEWQRADDAAKAEIAGLGHALDEAVAEAKELDGELAAVRWQNAQMSTSLSRLRAAQETAESEIEAVRTELSARVEELAAVTKSRDEITAQVGDLQQAVDAAQSKLGRAHGQLGVMAERLNEANAALTVAGQERDRAEGELEQEQAKAARLNGELAAAEADLEQAQTARRALEARLVGLERAATAATDAARQNLLAVQSRIAALNSTLAKVDLEPAAPAPLTMPTGTGNHASLADDSPAETDRLGQIDSAPAARDADGADLGFEEAALAPAPAGGPVPPADGELALIKLSESPPPRSSRSLTELTAELPVEGRIQAQSLLADLQAETDSQGVKLTVPGGELFTVNGQEVRPTAHDSPAKVAELINRSKSQPVLIIGHTAAVGAPDYNKTLSERRASLVRQFFIDNFDVAAVRLSTQGMGEQRPIESNATAAGRRANRRVEVLILN